MFTVRALQTKTARWVMVMILAVVGLSLLLFEESFLERVVPGIQGKDRLFSARHSSNNTIEPDAFLIPSDEVLRRMDEKEMILLYWRYVNTLQVLCQNQMRHGDLQDGGKEVCLDVEFVPNKPCLVYSFGSALRFEFEKSILQAYGCEVHTFDPSYRIDASNKKKIPANVTYHEIGLGGRNFVDKRGWTIKTLPSVINSLGHDHRVIDILKIDAEGAEWSGFQNASHFDPLKDVKQLLVELHFGRFDEQQKGRGEYWGAVPTVNQLQVLRNLYEKGFRIFMREHTMSHIKNFPTVYSDRLCSINEISLINMKWRA